MRVYRFSESAWVTILLAAFCLINLLVCTHTPTVFVDEVQYVDPAANLYFGGGFTSSLWGQDWHEFCLTYVPLYEGMLIATFKLFGFGFFQARALSTLLAAAGSFLIWRSVCNLAIIQKPANRLLCLALTLSGSASSFAFRHIRPDAAMFFVVALLFFACSLKQRPRLRAAMLCLSALLLAPGGLALGPYVGLLMLVYLAVYRFENFRLLLWIAAGALGGLALLTGYLVWAASGLKEFINLEVRPRIFVGAGAGTHSHYWHDSLFGAGAENLFYSFFGNPVEFLNKQTLFDISAFLLFLLSLIMASLTWAKIDSFTRKFTLFVLAIALIVPPALHLIGHFFYYYRWMTYMPLAILAPRLLEVAENKISMPIRRFGLLIVGLSLALGIPMHTLVVLPSWKQRSPEPAERATKSVASPADIAICDFRIYFAVRPHVERVFAYGVCDQGDFSIVKNLPTNDISLLVLPPDEVKAVTDKVGGNWKKLPPEAVQGIADLKASRYAMDFYRRGPE